MEAQEPVAASGKAANLNGSTDYLVVGEGPGIRPGEEGEKSAKIIDEKGFKKLIGEG